MCNQAKFKNTNHERHAFANTIRNSDFGRAWRAWGTATRKSVTSKASRLLGCPIESNNKRGTARLLMT